MFVTEDAVDGCRIALDLLEASGGTFPAVRVGLATGEMASVFGDLYGSDVNLAARLVGAADPSTAVVSESVRAAQSDGFRFERLPPLALKGFAEPTTAYRLER
jgi:adenylate cyclase